MTLSVSHFIMRTVVQRFYCSLRPTLQNSLNSVFRQLAGSYCQRSGVRNLQSKELLMPPLSKRFESRNVYKSPNAGCERLHCFRIFLVQVLWPVLTLPRAIINALVRSYLLTTVHTYLPLICPMSAFPSFVARYTIRRRTNSHLGSEHVIKCSLR